MSSAAHVQKDVLSQIKPNAEQKKKIETISRKALSLSQKAASKYKGKAMLAGSVTRGTWLPDKMEFDVFILFPEKMSESQLEKAGLDVGKKVIDGLKGKHEVSYAQHPYVSGMVDGVDIDIVPAFAVSSPEKMKSAVDRTPFHVSYIEKNLPTRLADDVRLLKKMLKSNGAYGADSRVEGFSGYLCELLVINYGGFSDLMKAARKWEAGEVIDVEELVKKADYDALKKQFLGQPLIVIDPTDRNRNVAAAVSARAFLKLRTLAGQFAGDPSVEMFFEPTVGPISEQELTEILKLRRTQLVMLKFLPPRGHEEVVWPQMRKFAERVQGILEDPNMEFRIMNRGIFTDGSYLAGVLFEVESATLPAVQKRVGPSIFDRDDSARFVEKYKDAALAGPYVEGVNWVVEINRQFSNPREKLHDALARPLEELVQRGVPKLVAERIAKGSDVISENHILVEEARRNPAFGVFLRKFFVKDKLA
ncbi:MAG: CCA tRNA nucleotidyltransferase [Candidatus Aenigmarchaeota archaeon]|nr:CCA tRNA nucleotidyltransferase [Candidatus Aenigmarchaeota archaeon]